MRSFDGWAWKLALGAGTGILLVSAPLSRPLWPQFAGIVYSSRDVMAVWFSAAGALALGALAWRISPGVTWLVGAYVLSGLSYGWQGQSMANTQALLWGVAVLVLLTQAWPEHRGTILWALTVATGVHVLVSLSQFFVSDYGWPAPAGLVWRDPFFMTAQSVHEVEALASHYSLYAGFLAVAMPLLYLRVGWTIWLVTPAILLALQHRSSVMAAGLAAFLMIPGRRKWHAAWIAVALTALVILIRGSFTDYAGPSLTAWTGTRLDVWVVTLAKALQKPWLGWSPGAFFLWKPTFITPPSRTGLTFIQTHNEFLQLFFEVGLVGLAAVAVYAIHTGIRLRRARPWPIELRCAFASLMSLAFIAFFNFPFRIGVTAMGGIIALAALHGELLRIEGTRASADAKVAVAESGTGARRPARSRPPANPDRPPRRRVNPVP